ncbi:MAG: class I SAM-dependent methyltransferase [Acidobacteriota bacterium]
MHPDEYEKMFCLEDAHWWFAGKRRMVGVLLDSLPPNPQRKILDVGCGTGGMFLLLKGHGSLTGIDASELAIEFSARRHLANLARAALPYLPFGDACFDLVSAFDVLYHRRVGDDQVALKEIVRVLKPHGHLVITDSALGFLRSAHDDVYEAARRYRTGEMRGKLLAAGLAVKRLSYANFFIFPVAALWRVLRRGVSPEKGSDLHPAPPWINALMGGVYRVEAGVFSRMNLPIGTSIIALAEKI